MDVSVEMHDYAASGNSHADSENIVDVFSISLPETPTKPLSKKGKMETMEDVTAILLSISSLINKHSDSLEKLVSANAMKIEGLKKIVEFVKRRERKTRRAADWHM